MIFNIARYIIIFFLVLVLAWPEMMVHAGVEHTVTAADTTQSNRPQSAKWLMDFRKNNKGSTITTITDLTYLKPEQAKTVHKLKTAKECLALADEQIALGYYRLNRPSGKYHTSANDSWRVAIACFLLGDELVNRQENAGHHVSKDVQANLIAERARFLFLVSSQNKAAAEQEVDALKAAVSLKPKLPRILTDLAWAYGDLTNAKRKLGEKYLPIAHHMLHYAREAVALQPHYALAYWSISGSQNALGKYDLAVKNQIKALEYSQWADPHVFAYDYHFMNNFTRGAEHAIKRIRPTVYQKIYRSIAYFSPQGKVLFPNKQK